MLDLLKATQSIKLDVPETDLSKLEKQSTEANKKLDEANKHLKKISEKPTGGGGGGGTAHHIKTVTAHFSMYNSKVVVYQ